MADDAKQVAAELVNAKCGIIAFPFYSKLDRTPAVRGHPSNLASRDVFEHMASLCR